jgi:hypothetical protein
MIDTSKMVDNENKRPSTGLVRTAVKMEIWAIENYIN